MTDALELDGIVKSFPGVMALRGASLRVAPGTIHALLGENGAGKSTLIKVITGVHRQEAGTIRVGGRECRFAGPTDAIAAGIGVVHQERNLIQHFSVGENILLDRIARASWRPIDYAALHAEATDWLRMLDLTLDPRTRVSTLSVATMQMVEIARALSLQSRVLLMDEPTASLTPHETRVLFGVMRRLRDQGVAIVFVSHKLEEVLELCDSVTVLRDGQNACQSRSLAGCGRGDLVQLMIGRSEQMLEFAADASARHAGPGAAPALRLRGVATELGHAGIDLELCCGEVLGLYGLVGAGRSELARAIIGQHRITAGTMEVDGKAVRIRSVAEALERHAIGYVSEDRKREGVILQHGVLANAGVTIWSRLRGWMHCLADPRIVREVRPVLDRLEVKTPSLMQPVAALSGGNQQKVSLAKWLVAGTRILIVDEPTVGIDVGTKAYFHALIHDLARQGTAVLLISSDMPELITLSDRILVMNRYRIAGGMANDRNYDTMSRLIMAHIHESRAA